MRNKKTVPQQATAACRCCFLWCCSCEPPTRGPARTAVKLTPAQSSPRFPWRPLASVQLTRGEAAAEEEEAAAAAAQEEAEEAEAVQTGAAEAAQAASQSYHRWVVAAAAAAADEISLHAGMGGRHSGQQSK